MSVYFIQAGARGPVKIGIARDVLARLVNMQTANPAPLRVLATEPGEAEREAELHCRFGAHRLQGEWFHPASDLLAYIASLEPFVAKVSRLYAAKDSKLAQYMVEHGFTCLTFAQLLGVSAPSVSRWVTGADRPAPAQMRRVIEATGGEVQPNDFYAADLARALKQGRSLPQMTEAVA